ncbi:TonB-dependent receptor plug domain-containing protein [Algoriphagus namhaensis]
MKKLILLFALGACVSFIHLVQAQETLPEKIQSYFNTYQAEYPVEKIYLQLDKSTYTLGEDIWFSVFLTAGSSQIPSPLSKPVYVDVFDGNGLLLEGKTIRMEEGRGSGNFTLPAFGNPGEYQIKAYTAWMKNFGKEYFYEASVAVVDGEGGSFLPEVKFKSISEEGGQIAYSVDILAVNKSGAPLSGAQLELKAKSGDTDLHSQNLVLNDQGEASFTFKIPAKAHPSQHLELTYLEGGTYPVIQKISLPYSLSYADIQFLPESGHWILGKKSQMAFRAIYPDGRPVMLEGTLEQNPEISFQSNFAGLGKFEITPDQNVYTALITEKGTGATRQIDLPKVEEQGLVMQVVNNPAASYITAFVQGNVDLGELLLVSQTRGIINYMIQGQLTNGVWGVRIPKENLLSGINQISVLDREGKPLLERLLFYMGEDQLDLEISTTGTLSKRSKIGVDIKSSLAGVPSLTSFAVAVVDGEQVDLDPSASNIFSALLVSSDLKGGLYSPGTYFSDENGVDLEGLDLVMLTHGWSRFSWEEILSGTYPKIESFIERGINIEGQVIDQDDTKKGLAGGSVNAIVGEGIEILSTEFGPNGRFILREMDYLDSATVTITAEDKRLKNFVDVEVIQPEPTFSEIEGAYPDQVLWPESLVATVQERRLQQQMTNPSDDFLDLEAVTVEGQTMQKEEEEQRKIYGTGDVTIRPEDIPSSVGFTNVFQLIQGRVSGVQVFVSGLDVSVQIRGVGSINSGTSPLFLLDNIPVDAQTLLQISPRDVSSVDVFKDPARAAIFGAQGANGVIAVYTKQGMGIAGSVGGTLVTKYGGFSSQKEFYQPMYDEDVTRKGLDDKRATIYWNPIVKTDESGQAKLEYYNTDIAKRQILIIEGMNDEGKLGRAVKVLQ